MTNSGEKWLAESKCRPFRGTGGRRQARVGGKGHALERKKKIKQWWRVAFKSCSIFEAKKTLILKTKSCDKISGVNPTSLTRPNAPQNGLCASRNDSAQPVRCRVNGERGRAAR